MFLSLEKSLVYFSTSLKSNETVLEKILRYSYPNVHVRKYDDDEDLLEDAITEPALYTVRITDALGNTKELSFTIIETHYFKFEQELDNIPGFEGIKVNGNDFTLDKGTLVLTDSGEYVVDVTANGMTYSFTVNIDSAVDYTIDVHDKGLANTVTLNSTEDLTVTVTKDGEVIEYELGATLTETGAYTVKMVDMYGNAKELSFTIIESLYASFEQEIDEIPGFEKVLVNGEEVTLEKGTLSLAESGTHEVTIVANGVEQVFTVNVDSTPPTVIISGVENGGVTEESVTISALSEKSTIIITRDDEKIEYALGEEIKEPGEYKVTVTDSIGNITEYTFEIKEGVNGAVIALVIIGVVAVAGTVAIIILKKKKVF